MIFFGIKQKAIYKSKKEEKEDESLIKISDVKYKSSAIKDEHIEKINKMVFGYLKLKKPYLNPEYILQMMVDDLDISRQILSQVINSSQKKNFYKLINEFRVEEVKEMLLNPAYKNYTVLGIAYECGFNSKTSFNRIFKEETAYTPTEFKKNILLK